MHGGITHPIPFGNAAFGYEVVSVRFRNDPRVANDASIAVGVGAEVAVFDLEDRLVFGPRVGQWVDESRTKSPFDHGPLEGTVKTINMSHGPIPAKLPLLIDVRVPNDGGGWFLFEGKDYIGRAHLRFPRGSYRLRVRLSGVNVRRGEADFWFSLGANSGKQPDLILMAKPEK